MPDGWMNKGEVILNEASQGLSLSALSQSHVPHGMVYLLYFIIYFLYITWLEFV
nr:MAG TPA: hypothetical protein [Caudoviricetes sp.]